MVEVEKFELRRLTAQQSISPSSHTGVTTDSNTILLKLLRKVSQDFKRFSESTSLPLLRFTYNSYHTCS